MATSPRRKFSAQFKAEAVQMVVQNDRPIAQVAKELQINEGTLGNWVKLYREQNPEPEPELKPSDRVRLAELEAEVRELRMENEFLKKAALDSNRQCNTPSQLMLEVDYGENRTAWTSGDPTPPSLGTME
ncbi:transposase, partial [Yaniella flava]|uniref:transposase n=1 Tax=Yaniella flava TaxID=287930 RepID=UPI0031D67029